MKENKCNIKISQFVYLLFIRKGGFLWKLLGSATVTAGGVVGYAWYDPNFRKQIEDNVPYSKEAFDTIFGLIPKTGNDPPRYEKEMRYTKYIQYCRFILSFFHLERSD